MLDFLPFWYLTLFLGIHVQARNYNHKLYYVYEKAVKAVMF